MRFVFNEAKAAEAAAHFLKLGGGTLNYMCLIKYLYLADRKSLVETGFPVTGDRMVSMPQGPVLSNVLDLINNRSDTTKPSPWYRYVSPPSDYEVTLVEAPPAAGKLSDYELRLIGSVFEEYGALEPFKLVALLHSSLPEWKDPHGSSSDIEPAEILSATGWTDQAIADLRKESEAMWQIELATSLQD